MSKLFTRATVSGATLSGANLKAALTALWDALNSQGATDASRTTVTATATLVTTQCGLLLVDATSAAIVLTLPTSGAATDDCVYTIVRIDSSANLVTLQRGGTDTLVAAGLTTLTIPPLSGVEVQLPAGATLWRATNMYSPNPVAQTFAAFTTAGSAPAYTITPAPAIAALAANQRYRIKLHASTTGAATLAVSGLAATGIKQYDSTGAKIDPVLVANQLCDVEYDGTHWVILDPLPTPAKQIQPITASVAANALTCTLNPTALDFRSATLTSGTVNARTVAAAISVVVPSTATLGTVNAQQSRIAVLAIDNAGTVELAVVNISGGNNLDESTLISTTAISAGATAANVIYSTTARTNVPFRVVGYVESTQATAGTWATAPSTIQGMGGNALAAMSSLGYGQTLGANLYSGSRAYGTTYYNTKGKPITVFLGTSNSASITFTISIGSGSWVPPSTGVASSFNCTFIVPPGMSYSIAAAGGTPTTNVWQELS